MRNTCSHAVDALREAIDEQDWQDTEGIYLLAIGLAHLGQREEAAKLFRQAEDNSTEDNRDSDAALAELREEARALVLVEEELIVKE